VKNFCLGDEYLLPTKFLPTTFFTGKAHDIHSNYQNLSHFKFVFSHLNKEKKKTVYYNTTGPDRRFFPFSIKNKQAFP